MKVYDEYQIGSGKKRGRKTKEELQKEEADIICRFDSLKSADKILKLFQEGYDMIWNGKSVIIFFKGNQRYHAKNVTKEIYDLVFARYCIEFKKHL